jgi:hypothetical protein
VFYKWTEEDQHTPRERTFPGFEVLGNLRHFDVGVKLVNFIQNGILVVVAKVISCLLLGGAILDDVRMHASRIPLALVRS